ncbi:hypothetical protein [Leucobacter aridicollis]|uniref:hypothetical protein n=1 Tax=Leucobacter aridicollis TaxID=283878 RepID=UPI000EB4BF43
MSTTAPISLPSRAARIDSGPAAPAPTPSGHDGAPGNTAHTAPAPAPPHRVHEHAWHAESSHPTSEGIVSYVRCVRCGARRVELRPLAPRASRS